MHNLIQIRLVPNWKGKILHRLFCMYIANLEQSSEFTDYQIQIRGEWFVIEIYFADLCTAGLVEKRRPKLLEMMVS